MVNIAIIIEALLRSLIYVLFPSRRAQEVLMLRKELQVLKRQVKKPRFTDSDRLLLVALSRLRWRVTQRLVTIRPETVLRWHRALVAGKWDFSRARSGRPVITDDIRLLVVEMKKNNPRWGLRRIKGELRKIGVSLSKSCISNILNAAGYPPKNREFVESWIPFLKSHGKRVFACDFLTVETAFLKRLYVFAIMDTKTRKIVSAVVTRNPTAAWLEQVFRNCFMMAEYLPDFVVTDRDGIYGEWLRIFLEQCYGIRLFRTPPRTPNCNAFIERWNRSLREELLDRRIFFGRSALQRSLNEYVAYYNDLRPHQGLALDAPNRRLGEFVQFEKSRVRRRRMVEGLVVDYCLIA